MSEHLYLYGFLAPDASGRDDDGPPPGVAGGRVDRVALGSVTAVVSAVSSDEFSAEVVQDRLQDMEWVKEVGAAHERVVTWHVDRGDILPVRMLTLYSGPDALRSTVGGRGEDLADELARLAGLREWDLKVTYDVARLRARLADVSDAVAGLDAEVAAAQPGKRFLLEKKRDKLVRAETTRSARAFAADVLEGALPFAERHRVLPVAGGDGTPVALTAALLVDRARDEALRAAVAPLAERGADLGIAVQLTGPWAPYRFRGGDEEEGS